MPVRPRWCLAPPGIAGWPVTTPPTAPAPQVNSAAIDDLAARLASIEARASKPAAAAPDPAAAARAEALEKSLAALRGELATQRAQVGETGCRDQRCEIGAARSGAAAGSVRDQRTHRPDRARRPGAERRDHQGKRASRPTMCRCAASWRQPCSTFSFEPAIPIPRRWLRRKRWRRIRMR